MKTLAWVVCLKLLHQHLCRAEGLLLTRGGAPTQQCNHERGVLNLWVSFQVAELQLLLEFTISRLHKRCHINVSMHLPNVAYLFARAALDMMHT